MKHNIAAAQLYSYSKNIMEAYTNIMKPLSEELNMAQPAVDIILFLANNPGYETAKDICKYRHLKPGIVSFHVDNLVSEGFLERCAVDGDRRKYRLICTSKALPIIKKGQALQEKFANAIVTGLSKDELDSFNKCISILENNVENIKKNGI